MSAGLIEEARRLASFAPEKPESVHDVVCAGFNELTEQLAARTRDFLAAVERNEEKDRRISDLEEQLEALREASETARGWLYHGLNGGGMKSARKAFDVLDAEFHGKASSPASEPDS